MGKNLPTGLSTTKAKEILDLTGPNLIPVEDVPIIHILLRQFKSPFNYLLFFAAFLAIFLKETTDGIFIISFTVLNTLLGFYQEYRSEQTIKLLMNYLKQKSTVVRDGVEQIISTENIVKDDLLVLKAGDIVPADCHLTRSDLGIEVDESSLTGESNSIIKKIGNPLLAGTTILVGGGLAVVSATGKYSQLGKLSLASSEITRDSNFEKNIGKVSSFTLKLITIILLATYIANLALKGASSLLETTLFSIALAVSVIPEALPVVITFSLSRGARSLASHKVVVKRLSSIEDLGGVEILATDKTGTITENKPTVRSILTDLPEELFRSYLGLASHGNDSVDQALSMYSKTSSNFPLLYHPFDAVTRYSQAVRKTKTGYLLIEKGILEQVLKRAHKTLKDHEKVWIEKEELEGHRVIALSYKHLSNKPTHSSLEKIIPDIAGFVSLADKLKPTATLAIQKARDLSIDVRIISGDSHLICETIGKSIGLITSSSEVVTETELSKLQQKDFHSRVKSTKIFARITPLMKSRIIDILQESSTVGFIGDGVNDGPALKSADVGIAVGGASDIAKSVADIILTQRSLLTIVSGIEEGRLVFANTSKYIKMTLAANIGNFFSVAIASLLVPYLPMLPIQILMVNLLSDFPMIAVAGDTTDKSEISRPLSYDIHEIGSTAIIFGIVSSIFDLIFFATYVRLGAEHLQTGWFIESIVTELLFFYSIRSHKPIWRSVFPPWGITLLTLSVVIITVILPFTAIGQSWLKLIPLGIPDLGVIALIIGSYLVTTEFVKYYYFRRSISASASL